MATVEERNMENQVEAYRMLALIERHGWRITSWDTPPDKPAESRRKEHAVGSGFCEHFAPTLIEALTEASRCPKCTGGEA